MNNAVQIADEIAVICPVCKTPQLFVEGEIIVSKQISFICDSEKCRGKRRYIKKEDLKKYLTT